MQMSNSIVHLAEALNAFQKEIRGVEKGSTNPFFNSKYASLGDVIEASLPVLTKHGLAITQPPISSGSSLGVEASNKKWIDDYQAGVETMLMHVSGEWISERFFVRTYKQNGVSDAQQSGITISYARRYAWLAILGMYASDDDNDGNDVSQTKIGEMRKKLAESFGKASEEQKAEFKKYCEEVGYNNKVTDEGLIKKVTSKLESIIKGDK